jgi:NifU-like protein involved in Fe-S cluster formation
MKSTQYSETTLEHFRNPRNVGTLEGDDVAVGRVGNPVCGDLMDIYIRVEDDRIADIAFQTFGCGSAVATSSMITELVRGLTLDDALKVSRGDVADALDGLPPVKMHCSNLAADALHEAIKNWREGITPDLEPVDESALGGCATGDLPVLGVEDFDGKGVYTSAPQLDELADMRVLVVDRGDDSARLAVALTEYTPRVVFMTAGKQPVLSDDVKSELKRSDVKLLAESRLLAVRGEFEVEKALVHDLNEDEEYELVADALVLLD